MIENSAPAPRRSVARAFATALLLSLAVGGGGSPAALADVLVMNDGSQIETRGEWEVRGRQVRFTLPNGVLSVVRLSEVDLEASRAATEAANNPAPAPAEEGEPEADPEEPVLVLTNDDIGRGSGPEAEAEAEGSGTGAAEAAGTAGGGSGAQVVVAEWNYQPSAGDTVYELVGTVENRSAQIAEKLEIYVDIVAVGSDGEPRPNVHLLRQANVESSRLEPQESTGFSYQVTRRDLELVGSPDDFESPRVSFDVQARRVAAPAGERAEGAAAPEAAAGDGAGG